MEKLQKTAYLFYALIYAHVMFIMVPIAKLGSLDYQINVLVYSLVFFTYGAMRIHKECVKKGLSKRKSLAPIIAATISFSLINGYAFYNPSSMIVDANDTIQETTEENIDKVEDINTEEDSNTEAEEEENKTEYNSEDESEVKSDSIVVESETNVSSTSDNKNNSSSQVVESNNSSSSNSSNSSISNSSSNSNSSSSSNNSNTTTDIESNTSIYKDGVYTGSSSGYNGNITVKVTIKNDNIVNVQVTETVDTEPFISNAISGIVNSILSNQSSNVDIVSGATYSSKGIINAVNNALAQAKR